MSEDLLTTDNVAKAVVEKTLEEKDITALLEEDLEAELEKDLEEFGDVKLNEEEVEEEQPRRLMTEDEFMRNIEEYRGKNHSLTVLIDQLLGMLAKKARKAGAEIDDELWIEVAKPSLNVFFWYEELVEGRSIAMSPQMLGLIGLGATVIYGLNVWRAYRETKSKPQPVKKMEEKEQRKVEEQRQAEAKREEAIERVKVKTDLLERVQANLAAG
ncbi:hypothetical protein [Thermococcus sp.]|uniref:hypothetical protein n=1 Tax=Thermococcus sp. TaxID=35749 RepID=UPI0025FBD968|nr:hypothetical protein [Thermococcus sp.]